MSGKKLERVGKSYLVSTSIEDGSKKQIWVIELNSNSFKSDPDLMRFVIFGNPSIIVYACDCSSEALERAKEVIATFDKVSIKQRFHPFVCDLSQAGFPNWLIYYGEASLNKPIDSIAGSSVHTEKELDDLSFFKKGKCCIGGMDFVTMAICLGKTHLAIFLDDNETIFTLSAVPFQSMVTAIVECLSVLKPGGLLLFRDYGLYDMTMLRFEPNKRVGFREYMRSDGTRSYFFSLDTVRELFLGAGCIELELEYCCVNSVNRLKGKTMRRVWVHGKFQKAI
ncbi:hypothetical protein IFM89_023199 [Coptis chinensis]|uniref:Methyltransferase-like protein n=1 Tax=Coptis chinensis TaxID=261450 RepID=A0A835M0F4_9MAGN|nr:hypothetical protein IFM89_023199 [Coptis chinensis]